MPLSDQLHDVDLSFNCPHCGRALIKPGRWFKSASHFKCKACEADVRLTYSTKIALFARYDKGPILKHCGWNEAGRGRERGRSHEAERRLHAVLGVDVRAEVKRVAEAAKIPSTSSFGGVTEKSLELSEIGFNVIDVRAVGRQ